MKKVLIGLALCVLASSAFAADQKPWYEQPNKPATLKAALAADRAFLGAGNPGYRMHGDPKLCAALASVKLACDYNTRTTLTMFLTVNGKDMFPAEGGTNPYYTQHDPKDAYPDDAYIGQPVQNTLLRKAVLRNAGLFKNGNLTAASATKWR